MLWVPTYILYILYSLYILYILCILRMLYILYIMHILCIQYVLYILYISHIPDIMYITYMLYILLILHTLPYCTVLLSGPSVGGPPRPALSICICILPPYSLLLRNPVTWPLPPIATPPCEFHHQAILHGPFRGRLSSPKCVSGRRAAPKGTQGIIYIYIYVYTRICLIPI